MYNQSLGWIFSPWWTGSPAWTSASASISWATVSVASVVMPHTSCRDQVDEREDDDPHDVDEVPVEADDLDSFGADLFRCPPRHDRRRHQHHDPDTHVGAVEAGERVE